MMTAEPTHHGSPPSSSRNIGDHSPVKAALHLDESDATSMTTTTSGTPSPFANSEHGTVLPSAESSPSSSSCSGDEKTTVYSRLTSLLSSTPRRVQSETSSSETSPSNCLDITPQHPNTTDVQESSDGEWTDDSDNGYHKDWKNSQTPLRRGSPWSIQQALFPEEETENQAPVLRQKAPTTAPMYPHEEYIALPIRTRRSTGTASFHMPQHHRRRNSTGKKKCRASPQPLPSSSSLLRGSPSRRSSRLSSSQQPHALHCVQEAAPYSHSKNKKYKQQRRELELPGLTLEDNNNNHNTRSSSTPDLLVSTRSSFSITSPNNNGWMRTIVCRLRLTTFVWGLLMIGLTSLGRVAMLTSRWDISSADPPLPTARTTPTAGLRGSLLLATVGRPDPHSQDHSTDAAAAKKKKTTTVQKKPDDKKKKKKKEEKPKPSTTTTKDKLATVVKGKTSTTATIRDKTTTTIRDKKKDKPIKREKAKPRTPKTSVVAQPPPLDPADEKDKVKYITYDPSMFKSSSSKRTYQSVVTLHSDVVTQQSSNKPVAPRKVELYPAEFTDNTQFYGEFDSSDERLRKMELRAPYFNDQCVPMQEWQTTFHPFCNGVHELGVEYLGQAKTETNVQLFGTKGYWRYAWRLDLRKQPQPQPEEYGDTVVLKTLKFRHDFEDAHFEHDRIDAVAMERLTSSPHVINIFGFCGHSVLTEYANGPRLGELADKSKSRPLARLKIARDIADGLADVHGIDNKEGNNATFVHLDINPANVVSIGGTLKLNDFNIGIIRRWNTTSQEPCGFPAQYPNPQWRSPEESRNENNLTEKVDVFSLGHIFFRLICGHEPWNKLEQDGRPSKEDVSAKVQKGQLPFIPETIMKSKDPEDAAIRDAMLECYRPDPKDRPRAREISSKLEAILEKLSAKE